MSRGIRGPARPRRADTEKADLSDREVKVILDSKRDTIDWIREMAKLRPMFAGKTSEQIAAIQQDRWCLTLVQLDQIISQADGAILESANFVVAEILAGTDPGPLRLRQIVDLWYASCDQKEGRIPRYEGIDLKPQIPSMSPAPQIPMGVVLELPPGETRSVPLRVDVPVVVNAVECRGQGPISLMAVVHQHVNMLAAPIYMPEGPYRIDPLHFPPRVVFPGDESMRITVRNMSREPRQAFAVFWGTRLADQGSAL